MTVSFTTESRDEGHKHMTVSTFTTGIRDRGHKSNAAHARQSLQYVYIPVCSLVWLRGGDSSVVRAPDS